MTEDETILQFMKLQRGATLMEILWAKGQYDFVQTGLGELVKIITTLSERIEKEKNEKGKLHAQATVEGHEAEQPGNKAE